MELQPAAVVDAILAKRNIGTRADMASVVVALGPGFVAPQDCDAVIETMRGHNLGRPIYAGSALPNTGVPGLIQGYGKGTCDAFPCGRHDAVCTSDRR